MTAALPPTGVRLLVRVGCACAVLAVAAAWLRAHPHDEPEIFEVRGSLAKVDSVNRAVEVDVVDSKGGPPRSLLLFVEAKAKIQGGKARLNLADLQKGQRVICAVERRHPPGRDDLERLIVFEIRLDASS
jgi:hypothetical protein